MAPLLSATIYYKSKSIAYEKLFLLLINSQFLIRVLLIPPLLAQLVKQSALLPEQASQHKALSCKHKWKAYGMHLQSSLVIELRLLFAKV